MSGLKEYDQFLGKKDSDMLWSDFSDAYRRNDKEVIKTLKTTLYTEEIYCAHGFMIVESIKAPLIVNNKIVGNFGFLRDIQKAFLPRNRVRSRHSTLERKEVDLKQILQSIHENKRHYLSGKFQGLYLTNREAECLVCFARGLTSKHIAKLLRISHRN